MAAPVASRRELILGLCAAVLAPSARTQNSLYEQSLTRALGPPAVYTEFLLLRLRAQSAGGAAAEVLVDRFADSRRCIPVGSLLKPFLALAFARSQAAFPIVTCHGHADRCWSVPGHGALTLPQAIAHSCNAYFLALARALRPDDIPYLPAAPLEASPETLIGLTAAWPIAPLTLARAYAALLTAPANPTVAAVREGMRLSARDGTASRIGAHPGGVLAKTGTAPCIDLPCRATGDGLVLACTPASRPALLLLVRHRATTGAATAADAGALLTRLETLHA